ncbi:MAG: type II toxin-antitoxin system VapC family toxin [Dehalococcoidia bacterium]|nr:type II toxin-antitoxin system VapC family toxin [Dehalococcoidia bacterium]
MALLVDSGIFILLDWRGRHLSDLAQAVSGEPIAVASITASELLVGVHRADSDVRRLRRENYVEAILEAVPVIPFDLRIARVHALLSAQLATVGQPVGAHDLLISATALAHGYSVLTENLRDFQRVPGPAVQRPNW